MSCFHFGGRERLERVNGLVAGLALVRVRDDGRAPLRLLSELGYAQLDGAELLFLDVKASVGAGLF